MVEGGEARQQGLDKELHTRSSTQKSFPPTVISYFIITRRLQQAQQLPLREYVLQVKGRFYGRTQRKAEDEAKKALFLPMNLGVVQFQSKNVLQTLF